MCSTWYTNTLIKTLISDQDVQLKDLKKGLLSLNDERFKEIDNPIIQQDYRKGQEKERWHNLMIDVCMSIYPSMFRMIIWLTMHPYRCID